MGKKASKVISLLLALSLLLSACGAGTGGKTANLVMSPENTSVTTPDGVTVDVGDFVLDGEEQLTVSKGQSEDHSEDGYKIDVYDIRLGDLHELDDFITIRIPYDTTYCNPGQDPAKCVGAKYRNDATGEWEDVLFEVDAEKQELVIYTDHLSYYGAFYVDDEGRRNALITDVLDSPLSMDRAQTMDFASKIAANDPEVRSELTEFVAKSSDMFYDYADRLDNAINIATLGDVPEWLDTSIPDTNQTLFSALGYISTATNIMKIAAQETLGGGASKGDILNLMRDVGSKVTTYWADAFTTVGSGALSVGMGGVLIIDKMLTAFAEEAKSTKLEDVSYVYHHYNEGFSGFGHTPMRPKDWREKVIQVIENHPNDPEIAINALEAGFNKYASEFFSLSEDQMAEVAADTPGVTIKRIPFLTQAEQQQLIDEYVAHLKDTTMPAVLKSVENYLVKKSEQVQLAAMNEIKNYYNTNISITIQEEIPEGGKSQYAGYLLRFAPLSEGADKKNWSGKWPESGKITSSSTLIGFMTAGFPHTVQFFKPDADMDADEPEFTVPFVISMPSITISINGAPTFDELVGYYADGKTIITDLFVSDELRQSLASTAESDDPIGCDLSEIIPMLEAQKGVPNEQPFTITKTAENEGILKFDDDEGGFRLVYAPDTGILSATYESEGMMFIGEFKAKYNGAKTGVELSGDVHTNFGHTDDLIKLTINIAGTKPLGQ